MKFVKMSAAGNDFILFDNRNGILSGDERVFFRQICERRRAVGADGIILLEKSVIAGFKYRHYNSDGSLAEMCGNGARAVCNYAVSRDIVQPCHTFEIQGVVYEAWVSGNDVKLGMPSPTEIKVGLNIVTEKSFEEGGFIALGVPHFVIFVKDTDGVNVPDLGRRYGKHSLFKNKTNVNFVQICNSCTIKVRTFERGVEEETLSCGTGSAASAIFAHIVKNLEPPIIVQTSGGSLTVNWKDYRQSVFLSGEARIIYEAELVAFLEK